MTEAPPPTSLTGLGRGAIASIGFVILILVLFAILAVEALRRRAARRVLLLMPVTVVGAPSRSSAPSSRRSCSRRSP